MYVCESELLSSAIKMQMVKELLNDIIMNKMNSKYIIQSNYKQLKIIITYVKYLNVTLFLLDFTCLYTQ